ncbi:UDP-glucose--hexose-1-phosphate uridylyltransferase [Carnobacterium gallinarum]|uniref:UDP-glucose--hexose-1-phosphate uridylyltransferase n=1 Tax=Carnobacterium gallinarum TaxID=2749 RepID=UPI0005549849|nr:UDP-glucose--hexose-1-phosphate uridylyltransferase [Carnobacterium gallinarum]
MIDQQIIDFIEIGIIQKEIASIDRIYLTNLLAELIGKKELKLDLKASSIIQPRLTIMDQLVNYAIEQQVISLVEREMLEAQIMDLITPMPSAINHEFQKKYQENPITATDYFYQISQNNNYIKTREIAKNDLFTVETKFGLLEITINLSKPEKDPKQIALEKLTPAVDYPKCLLCIENEGYAGRVNHPARTQHRIIRLELNQEAWGFQYSPYAYYEEHCIFLAAEHRPMKIEAATFRKLFGLVQQFPHYFVGSNADLPIVGGSILSHDHYQGGRHIFGMAKALLISHFKLPDFPTVSAGIVKWPMSVIRLSGENQHELELAAVYILEKWRGYSDNAVAIQAVSADGTPHNTVTPIVRKNGIYFELDLVLRNNRTTADYPDGIFHPHKESQHIKKENIGLIEVMGLAILPPRLKEELQVVRRYLLNQAEEVAPYHQIWAAQLKQAHSLITVDNVTRIIEEAVGMVFLKVLEDAGVFKQTEIGLAAFNRFILALKTK